VSCPGRGGRVGFCSGEGGERVRSTACCWDEEEDEEEDEEDEEDEVKRFEEGRVGGLEDEARDGEEEENRDEDEAKEVDANITVRPMRLLLL
jgi:hypothetical protein